FGFFCRELWKRSCGERCIRLRQTVACRTCIPAYVGVEEESVEQICPAPARPVSGTDEGETYVPAPGWERRGCVFEDYFNLSCCQPGVLLEHERRYSRYVRRCKAGSSREVVVRQCAL